jgi:uncharacterized protein YllA (UPF0747 family)
MTIDKQEMVKQLREEAKRLQAAADLLDGGSSEQTQEQTQTRDELIADLRTGPSSFEPTPTVLAAPRQHRVLSPETKKKMAEAQQRRWAALKGKK